jgi:hypothetical protein
MQTQEDVMKAKRREEAILLVHRLMSDWSIDRKSISEVRAASLDRELMARDPSHVSDNLAWTPSPLMLYDLKRLLTLIEQGV